MFSINYQYVKSISYFDVCIGIPNTRVVLFVHKLSDDTPSREKCMTCELSNDNHEHVTDIQVGRRLVFGLEIVRKSKPVKGTTREALQ